MPDSAPNKRLLNEAKKGKRYIDLTFGKGAKTLILMLDGRIIGCPLTPKTMLARLNAPDLGDGEVGAQC